MQKYISSIKSKIILVSIALGILFGIVHSFIDVLIFHEGGLASNLFSPSPYEIYVRLLTMCLLIVFAVIVQYMFIKHRKAEEALHASEENLKLYQALINQSNDSIEVVDPETGRFLNVNKKTSKDLGYSREELLSMKVFDIDPVVKPSDFPKTMEDLSRTGGIAHDFNNILTAVIGYANLLKMKMGRDDTLKVNLDQILAASEKGANLTQSLLAFSRQQISNPAPVNINEIIRQGINFAAKPVSPAGLLRSVKAALAK